MDCGGRSPQAISLKFLLDRWNCLETIMQCFGWFFLFFLKTFSLIQYLFIAATFLMYVTGGEKTEQKKKKDRVFLSFFHNCAYNNLGSERQNKSINCPSLFLDPVTDAF